MKLALKELIVRRRRSRRHGGDLDMDYVYVTDGGAGTGFDPFEAAGDLFDSALEGGLEGIEALDGALDSVADSIDSAVDAGVDSGGGDCGGGGD
ncbi:MAG: hypothetical protein M3433_04215 [Actinomycetota bacterium]|nr:hypothetical protein [Actinomycetota bacterium]MDQ3647779.1 hypothetical protein [Actinomycetota bacterium]